MAGKSSRVVVDSSVFINFFTGGATDEPGWLQHSTWVFEAATQGIHEVIVPTIVIAEVAGNGKVRGSNIQPEVRKRRIKRVKSWIEKSDFTPIELTYDIARNAADLSANHQLHGPDATIVASALAFGCPCIYSWDTDLLKLDSAIGALRVIRPAAQATQEALDIEQGPSV